MMCPICKIDIVPEEEVFMIACDKPYFNVYAHRACYKSLGTGLNEYVRENLEVFMDIFRTKIKK